MKITNKLICSVLLILLTASGCKKNTIGETNTTVVKVNNYYVSPNGSDSNNGLSEATAFKTIAKAVPYAQPGGFLYFSSGTYDITSTITITNSGEPNKYITFAALPGASPKIIVSGNIYSSITINASYIKFEGIEVQGNNANLDLIGATNAYNAALAGGATTGTYNTGAIQIGGPRTESKFPHHVEIRNCKIHDFPGGGIGAIQADYITIEGNTVYNNNWYTMYAPSGISILNPFNSDDATGYKNFVRNNVTYGNKTQVPWISAVPARLSDGNGIIIDVNVKPYGAPDSDTSHPYNGKTLVENNISFNNGGSGIHALLAGHVDIINNTAYGNGTVTGSSDIYASYCNDVRVMNNIAYARTGGKTNDIKNNTNVTYDYNIYYNSSNILIMGVHDIVADPQFVTLSTDPAVANFQLKASSPAVNSATTTLFSTKDFLGIARPKGTGPDRGAYESY